MTTLGMVGLVAVVLVFAVTVAWMAGWDDPQDQGRG